MTKCVKCGYDLEEDDVYCPDCGEKIKVHIASGNENAHGETYLNPESYYDSSIRSTKSMALVFGISASVILFFSGINMIQLESVSGTSVAEVFYQLMGWTLIGISCLSSMLTLYVNNRIR